MGQRALPSLLQGLKHSCRWPLPPASLLQSHCLGRQHLLLLQPTCYCGGGGGKSPGHSRLTRGCKAGPTGGGRRVRPRASSCPEPLAGDSRAGWPVRKVGAGWLEPLPGRPTLRPRLQRILLLLLSCSPEPATAASTDYPPAAPAAAAAGSQQPSSYCSNWHPPPAACAALSQLQPKQSLPVRVETYATRKSRPILQQNKTQCQQHLMHIALSVNVCTRSLIGEILIL